MRYMIFAATLLLAACAQPKDYGYRNVTAQPRSDDQLRADAAACDWEVTRVRMSDGASIIPVGPAFHEQCMAARGWQLVYAR